MLRKSRRLCFEQKSHRQNLQQRKRDTLGKQPMDASDSDDRTHLADTVIVKSWYQHVQSEDYKNIWHIKPLKSLHIKHTLHHPPYGEFN